MRRRPLVRQESKASQDIADEILKIAEGGAQQILDAAEMVSKSSWLRRAARYALYAAAVFAVLVFLGLTTAYFMVEERDVTNWFVDLVEEQTGGKLEIGTEDLSVFTGITFGAIKFYPPLDAVGFRDGGRVAEKPLLALDALKLHYRSWKLFVAKLDIHAALLDRPSLYIEIDKSGTNVDGISAYRQRKFPESEDMGASGLEADEAADDRLPEINTLLLFVPFRLAVADLGFRNLRLDLRQYKAGKLHSTVAVDGISSLSRLKWFGFSSFIEHRWLGDKAGKFHVAVEDYSSGTPKLLQADLKLDFNFNIEDLEKIALSYDLDVERLLAEDFVWRHLRSRLQSSLFVDDAFRQMRFAEFTWSALDAIEYTLSGDITLPDDNLQRIRFNLEQSMRAELKNLNTLLQQKVPGGKLAGSLVMERFTIAGDWLMPKDAKEKPQFPHVNSLMHLRSISASVQDWGLEVKPIEGLFSMATAKSLLGEGSQLDTVVEIEAPQISLRSASRDDESQLKISEFSSRLTGRLLYPKLSLPVFKLNAHADEFLASGKDIDPVNVPFDLEVDADFKAGHSRGNLDARIDLVDLAESSVALTCRKKCSKFKADASVEVRSLNRFYQLVRPLALKVLPLRHVPTKLEGAIMAKIGMRGHVPGLRNFQLTSTERLAIELAGNVDLRDLAASVPQNQFSINGFNSRGTIDGNLHRQRFSLRQDFNDLSVLSTQQPRDGDHPLEVKDFKLDANLTNEMQTSVDIIAELSKLSLRDDDAFSIKPLQQLFAKTRTKLSGGVSVGSIDRKGAVPKPILGVGAKLNIEQQGFKTVRLSDSGVAVAEYGLQSFLHGGFRLTDRLRPVEVDIGADLSVTHGKGQAVLSNVETLGSLTLKSRLKSTDLQTVTAEAKAVFSGFHLKIPGEDPGTPLIHIEEVNGEFPIKQHIDIERFVEAFAPSPIEVAAVNQPASDAVTVEQLGAEDQKMARDSRVRAVADEYFERTRDIVSEKTNKITLVDYGSVRPFYPNREPISIRRIAASKLSATNVELDVEVRQNWFAVNHYSMEFLGGKVQGDLQLAFDPKPRALRTSVHTTRLDTRKLLQGFPKLKRKTRSWSLFTDPYFDGTAHVNFDVRSNNIEGGLDITSIGKEQMRMILFYVDPESKDPTISQIRRWLTVGEVDKVSVPIKNGFIGLEVGVNVLGAPIPVPSLRGFPLAQFIDNYRKQASEQPAAKSAEDDSSEEDVKPVVEKEPNIVH